MKELFKFRDIPADFGQRFPDGTYTVGRGADPRMPIDGVQARDAGPAVLEKARKSTARGRKRVARVAAG